MNLINKNSNALKTIGEISDLTKIPQHVLRFWEKKFTILDPIKRRGRRYYNPEDVKLLEAISHLLYNQGFTVKGVQLLISKHNNDKENIYNYVFNPQEKADLKHYGGSDKINIVISRLLRNKQELSRLLEEI